MVMMMAQAIKEEPPVPSNGMESPVIGRRPRLTPMWMKACDVIMTPAARKTRRLYMDVLRLASPRQ